MKYQYREKENDDSEDKKEDGGDDYENDDNKTARNIMSTIKQVEKGCSKRRANPVQLQSAYGLLPLHRVQFAKVLVYHKSPSFARVSRVADFNGIGGRLKMESLADFSGICSLIQNRLRSIRICRQKRYED